MPEENGTSLAANGKTTDNGGVLDLTKEYMDLLTEQRTESRELITSLMDGFRQLKGTAINFNANTYNSLVNGSRAITQIQTQESRIYSTLSALKDKRALLGQH